MKSSKEATIADFRDAIPKECFNKSLVFSMTYMICDFTMLYSLYYYKEQIPYLIWINLTGFIYWCIFVIGHDCGHTTFSNYSLVNNICGHVCHTILNVPFFPWKFSHNLHHRYHNHYSKDTSHIWIKQEEVAFANQFFKIPFIELIAYTLFYLVLGVPDGSHVAPNSKLFTKSSDRFNCFISTGLVVLFDAFLIKTWDLETLGWWYVLPIMVFNFWLYVVTYLQHHHDDTQVYEEGEWTFMKGGMETIDRTYGFGIDQLSHNITDGHFVHHLFFTKIPHYHLKTATEAIKPILGENYKYKSSWDFFVEYHRLKYSLGYLKGNGILTFKE